MIFFSIPRRFENISTMPKSEIRKIQNLEKCACAAPLGIAEPNQFLPIGMCVLSYTVACFVLPFEKICKLRFRIPLSLFAYLL